MGTDTETRSQVACLSDALAHIATKLHERKGHRKLFMDCLLGDCAKVKAILRWPRFESSDALRDQEWEATS